MHKFHFPMPIIVVNGVLQLNNSLILKWLVRINVVNFCFCLWRVRHSCGSGITLHKAKLQRKGGNRSCKMWQVLMQVIAMIQFRNYQNWDNKVARLYWAFWWTICSSWCDKRNGWVFFLGRFAHFLGKFCEDS